MRRVYLIAGVRLDGLAVFEKLHGLAGFCSFAVVFKPSPNIGDIFHVDDFGAMAVRDLDCVGHVLNITWMFALVKRKEKAPTETICEGFLFGLEPELNLGECETLSVVQG